MTTKAVTTVKIPIQMEIEEIAKKKGVSVEKLITSLENLLLLEAIAIDSELSIEDAITIGKR
ncbi:hypothetical protein A3L04_09380 [Thermococcus chitonophagus]|uniref:Uncharacterized protein n=1 Tax=Thermococcus chitonophagus TaxID=54262 RepID=A0A160VS46_9EURY|nr:hypothetical protein [Thermococcus chitonophagus]ASJ17262.1 hypothetical protein A3L04_09380 [Thermococcus chitonophagus]CUX77883.1 hypothetical protein CHITON_1104 [Thermococcus chitonophagus]